MHAHIRTHTRTHTCTHTYIYTPTHTHTYIHTPTYIHIYNIEARAPSLRLGFVRLGLVRFGQERTISEFRLPISGGEGGAAAAAEKEERSTMQSALKPFTGALLRRSNHAAGEFKALASTDSRAFFPCFSSSLFVLLRG
jgi:hypothetical protein